MRQVTFEDLKVCFTDHHTPHHIEHRCATLTDNPTALAAYTQLRQAGIAANLDTFMALMTIYFKNRDWPNVKLTYSDIHFKKIIDYYRPLITCKYT